MFTEYYAPGYNKVISIQVTVKVTRSSVLFGLFHQWSNCKYAKYEAFTFQDFKGMENTLCPVSFYPIQGKPKIVLDIMLIFKPIVKNEYVFQTLYYANNILWQKMIQHYRPSCINYQYTLTILPSV